MTYKNYMKRISKIDNSYTNTQLNRDFFYSFYFEYFSNLMLNYFTWENLPETIDPLYIEKTLVNNGYIGFFEDEKLGIIAQRGAFSDTLDIYDNPTFFIPTPNNFKNFKKRRISWYLDDYQKGNAIIVGNNQGFYPMINWLHGFCLKLAEIEQTIQVNRNAQLTPYIILADKNTEFSYKNMMAKVMNGEPILYVNAHKDINGNLEMTQPTDLIQLLNTTAPYLLDKLHDEKQRVINQILTFIGINNNAVDKAERLVQAEATSNNGLINASIEVMLKSREIAVERLNKHFNLNIKVYPSERIEQFNTEITNDLFIPNNFGNDENDLQDEIKKVGDD